MGLSAARDEFNRLRGTLGKRALNVAFPDDFELYLFAFELVNSEDKTLDYLILPVNPKSISETEQKLVNISKTGVGYVAVTNSTFQEKVIQIRGNFGKKFKFLIGGNIIDIDDIDFSNIRETLKNVGSTLKKTAFNSRIKTGYGVTKKFKSMLNRSLDTDEYGKPLTLYFYNLALGTHYIVKPVSEEFSQNVSDSNMIWEYNIQFRALSNIDKSKDIRGMVAELSASQVVQKGVNNAINNIRKVIRI